jgi:hypothetical protein
MSGGRDWQTRAVIQEALENGLRELMVAGIIEDDRLEYRLQLEGFEIFPAACTASALLAKVKDVLAPK